MYLILPTLEQQTRIRQVLKEDVTTHEQELETIKEWLRKQPHLPDTFDDRCLLNFLRNCKFSMEKCKKKLDMYFTMRALLPEFFKNRDVSRPEIKEIFKYIYIFPLPNMTSDGKRVIVYGVTTLDFETPENANVVKIVFMLRDIVLNIEKYGSAGEVYVIDASSAIPKHIKNILPAVLKKFIICNLEAYPAIPKEIHFVNVTPFINIILNMITPFLKDKIKKRIHIHSSLQSLHEYVPKNILPEEFGGTAGKVEKFQTQFVKILEEYTPWFKEQEEVTADESKRVGKSYQYNDLFGVEGSFKRLNID